MEKIISPITGKSKYLLIENCEFVSNVKISNELKESLKLSTGKAGTLIVKNLPGTILNRENQNGRIYSTAVLAQAIREAKPLFETKQLLSQACEHPEGSFVSPTTASHVVTNAYIKKNVNVVVDGERGTYDMLFMDIEVLNTEEGKNLRALLEAECSVGTSIRGVGDMEGKYVKNYEFLGIDFVGNPSSSTFTRMPVSESVKVEMKDPREMKETFTVTTSSTNVVRDLDQAAMLQQQLDGLGYGTVTKTSTKLDQETDPKTGAQTSIATLEAETSDDVADLDQALQMARNAMLNGTINVDSITIENIPEEGETKEAVEATCEYVPEKTTLKEKPVNEDIIKNQDIGFFIDGKFVPMFHAGKDGHLTSLHSKGNKKVMKKEEAITEAKKEDDEDPNLGKKFVLHTDRGFVTFDKNAIDFTDKPEDALHFTEGKEESGMVSMSKVTEILDAMGIFEVQKYFQRIDTNLGGGNNTNTSEEEPKEEGVLASLGAVAGLPFGMPKTGYKIGQAIANGTADQNVPDTTAGTDALNEENGSNTKYIAQITINDANGSNNETIPVSSTDLESAKKEIANLYDMKAKTVENGTLDVMLVDTVTGEQMKYNSQSGLFESGDGLEINGDKTEVEIDDNITVEKEFDSPIQAKVAAAAVEKGKIDPEVLVPEATDEPEMVNCAWCKDEQDRIDCQKEKDMGWLCPRCVRDLESRGVELEFDDGIDEKLYNAPSKPSDELKKTTLNEAEDFLVTLKDIDWDIEAIIASLDDNDDIDEVIEALPDPWTIRVNEIDVENIDTVEQLKFAILKAANEQSPWAIKNATLDHVDDANTGLGVYDKATAEAPIVPDYYVD